MTTRKKSVVVLGAGLVGAPMAIDLIRDGEFDVTVVDINPGHLKKFPTESAIKTLQGDVTDIHWLQEFVQDFDIILSAVPGFIGYQTLKAVIEAGKDIVDISFFPEDLFTLDELAREKNVTAIADMGVAPGMSNLLIGYVHAQLDSTRRAAIYVGGLPKKRVWPYEYKAVFSPIDVIEEYTRPARYIENGFLVVRPALSDPELINFPEIGTLEAFNSDGLRSLAKTINCPNMIEKTLRYKGHIEIMSILRETGFFSKEPIEINGSMITPLEFTSKILFPKWKLEDGDEDLTIMRVIVEGEKDGTLLRYTYDLFDTYDHQTKTHSMARTTGYAATMAVRMVANGMYQRKGIIAPEFIGQDRQCTEFILKGLAQKGVTYHEMIEKIS